MVRVFRSRTSSVPAKVTFYRRDLPHFRVEGATYFVTWRLRPEQPGLEPAERSEVRSSLLHFHGVRYELIAWVVMNDHVHVVVRPNQEWRLEQLVHSWKSYTSNRLQREFGRPGSVWLREYYDRVVRDEAELLRVVEYTVQNPFKRWPELEHYEWVGSCL